MRRVEELKAPHRASAAVSRNDHVTTAFPIPDTGNSSFVVAIYIQMTQSSVMNINPPHLLLPLQYKSRYSKIYILTRDTLLPGNHVEHDLELPCRLRQPFHISLTLERFE